MVDPLPSDDATASKKESRASHSTKRIAYFQGTHFFFFSFFSCRQTRSRVRADNLNKCGIDKTVNPCLLVDGDGGGEENQQEKTTKKRAVYDSGVGSLYQQSTLIVICAVTSC